MSFNNKNRSAEHASDLPPLSAESHRILRERLTEVIDAGGYVNLVADGPKITGLIDKPAEIYPELDPANPTNHNQGQL